jgi:hypothetical protein
VSVAQTELEALAPGMVRRIAMVEGVQAVTLGGSRARRDHVRGSDFDIGIYYRSAFDRDALGEIANGYSDSRVELTPVGGWGLWVNGGGWLTVAGSAIDFIYRDIDRVHRVWIDCQAGRYTTHTQPGHPLGFWSHTYAGEVALATVLHDSNGELTSLKTETRSYPQALGRALVAELWEATFTLAVGRKAIEREDVFYVAGCLFRAVGVTTHAIHGHDQEWLLNEKGAVASASQLPCAPPDFARRVNEAFLELGPTRQALAAAITRIDDLVTETLSQTA